MNKGCFYFLKDKYFEDFKDDKLMRNKETISGIEHKRPCFYSFNDSNGIKWLIPISSQVDKYKKLYNEKILKYNKCDTIVFGEVLGQERAFLIQNMCPATEFYIKNKYIDYKTNKDVRIEEKLEKEIRIKASKVLALQRKGINLIFPNVFDIENKLSNKK